MSTMQPFRRRFTHILLKHCRAFFQRGKIQRCVQLQVCILRALWRFSGVLLCNGKDDRCLALIRCICRRTCSTLRDRITTLESDITDLNSSVWVALNFSRALEMDYWIFFWYWPRGDGDHWGPYCTVLCNAFVHHSAYLLRTQGWCIISKCIR